MYSCFCLIVYSNLNHSRQCHFRIINVYSCHCCDDNDNDDDNHQNGSVFKHNITIRPKNLMLFRDVLLEGIVVQYIFQMLACSLTSVW